VYLLVESELLEHSRKWFTSTVTSPEDAAIAALLAESPAEQSLPQVESVPPPPEKKPNWLRIFVGRILSCWQCTSAWASVPATGLVVLFALALQYNMYWAVAILSIFTVPPTGIGFVTMMDHLSPKRASESIVNAMTDIAQAVLTQGQAPEKPSPVDEARFRNLQPPRKV